MCGWGITERRNTHVRYERRVKNEMHSRSETRSTKSLAGTNENESRILSTHVHA